MGCALISPIRRVWPAAIRLASGPAGGADQGANVSAADHGGARLDAARRLDLARALQRLRTAAGMTQAELARAAGVGRTTAARYEVWREPAGTSWRTARDLAVAAGASREDVDRVVALASDTGAGWWEGDPGVPEVIGPLVAVEDRAAWMWTHATTWVPGLLQTEAYARAVCAAQQPPARRAVVDAQVAARLRRQRVLERASRPMVVHAVIDEAVLHRAVGGPEVMREQLGHLLALAARPTVTVQVAPYRAGATTAAAGHVVLLGRGREPDMAYLEHRGGGVYLDTETELTAAVAAYTSIRRRAATATDSRALIEAIREATT